MDCCHVFRYSVRHNIVRVIKFVSGMALGRPKPPPGHCTKFTRADVAPSEPIGQAFMPVPRRHLCPLMTGDYAFD